MKLYDIIFNSLDDFKKNILTDPTSNASMSGALAAEITLVSTLLLLILLLRHVNVVLTVIVLLLMGILLFTNIPIITKLKKEQDDSLNLMTFYVVLTLGILITIIYWGVSYV